MRKNGIKIKDDDLIIPCKYCNKEINVVILVRATKRGTEVRCNYCGGVIGKVS